MFAVSAWFPNTNGSVDSYRLLDLPRCIWLNHEGIFLIYSRVHTFPEIGVQ